jgi:hypothetical protein
VKGELSIKAIRGRTGRHGYHLIANCPTEHAEVQNFVLGLCNEDYSFNWLLENNATAKKTHDNFRAAIRTGITGEYFRGRRFQNSVSEATPNQFFAPPAGKQVKGRYNESGNRVLYLSRTPDTVLAECPWCPEKPRLFIQRFRLNLPKERMIALELDLETSFPYLHYLLLDSEYVPESTAEFGNVRNPYRATHFLAYLASLDRVSGIEYPSVRTAIQGDASAINFVLLGKIVTEVEAMIVGGPFLFSE